MMTRQDQIKAYLLLAIFLVAGIIFFGCAGGGSAPTYAPNNTEQSTEDMLRKAYDHEGIDYDEKMLKEDAAAVEQLYREFGG